MRKNVINQSATLIQLVMLLVISMLLFACEKEGDKESPIAMIETPSIGQEYSRGQVIYLNALFTDNEGLERCEVKIGSTKSTFGWDDPWEPETEVIALSGRSFQLDKHLLFNGPIPIDIMSSTYVIQIEVFDKSGNMSNYTRNIVID